MEWGEIKDRCASNSISDLEIEFLITFIQVFYLDCQCALLEHFIRTNSKIKVLWCFQETIINITFKLWTTNKNNSFFLGTLFSRLYSYIRSLLFKKAFTEIKTKTNDNKKPWHFVFGPMKELKFVDSNNELKFMEPKFMTTGKFGIDLWL